MNRIHTIAAARQQARRRLPSLHGLRAFEAAARCGSVTQAADELNVTHSAVSHQVKALEAALGVTLIRRQGRRIALTAAGQAYYPELEAAFDQIAQATQRITAASVRPSLTINVCSSFAVRWLIPRLGSFCSARPQVDVRLATTEKMFEFNPHLFDLSIRSLTDAELEALRKRRDWEGVETRPFLDESNFPVCSPALLRDKPLTRPADLRRHTLLHSRSAPHAWSEWLAAARSRIDASTGLTFDNVHFTLQAAARGLGVAIGSRPLVQEELDNGTLVAPFPGIESEFEHYHAIYPAASNAVAGFVELRDWLLDAALAAPPGLLGQVPVAAGAAGP